MPNQNQSRQAASGCHSYPKAQGQKGALQAAPCSPASVSLVSPCPRIRMFLLFPLFHHLPNHFSPGFVVFFPVCPGSPRIFPRIFPRTSLVRRPPAPFPPAHPLAEANARRRCWRRAGSGCGRAGWPSRLWGMGRRGSGDLWGLVGIGF